MIRPGAKSCFESPSYTGLPLRLEPVSVTDEKNIFEMFAQVMNENFMTDLALEISVCRDAVSADEEALDPAIANKRIVVVGASHGMRLASAMEEMGANIVDISVPGWKVTAEAVEAMRTELVSVLEEKYDGETIIIFQLFDNNMYLACDADGNRSMPVKMDDSLYHVPGRLVFIDRDSFKELFLLTLPLLRAGQHHTKILLTPLMRFVKNPCCNNASHITNRKDKTLAIKMGEAIGEVKEWLQDFAFTRRIRNFAILCPNTLLQGDSEIEDGAAKIKQFWTAGPVHMNQDGYACLASNLVDNLLDVKLKRPMEAKTDSGARRIPDRAATREDWVHGSDSSVHRQYGDARDIRGRSNWRGRNGGWRGHRGGRGRGKFFYKRNNPY
jgi:hypothetical protein